MMVYGGKLAWNDTEFMSLVELEAVYAEFLKIKELEAKAMAKARGVQSLDG